MRAPFLRFMSAALSLCATTSLPLRYNILLDFSACGSIEHESSRRNLNFTLNLTFFFHYSTGWVERFFFLNIHVRVHSFSPSSLSLPSSFSKRERFRFTANCDPRGVSTESFPSSSTRKLNFSKPQRKRERKPRFFFTYRNQRRCWNAHWIEHVQLCYSTFRGS